MYICNVGTLSRILISSSSSSPRLFQRFFFSSLYTTTSYRIISFSPLARLSLLFCASPHPPPPFPYKTYSSSGLIHFSFPPTSRNEPVALDACFASTAAATDALPFLSFSSFPLSLSSSSSFPYSSLFLSSHLYLSLSISLTSPSSPRLSSSSTAPFLGGGVSYTSSIPPISTARSRRLIPQT